MAINIPLFIKRLNATIAWTHQLSENFDYINGNYGTVFRQTTPTIHGKYVFNIKDGYTTWNIDDKNPDHYITILSYALGRRNTVDLKDFHLLGRILKLNLFNTTYDGAAARNSNCFLDESDIPPIDTWFYIEERTLYCWIPKGFEHVLEKGIAGDMQESHNWLDKQPEIYNDIRTKFAEYVPPVPPPKQRGPADDFLDIYQNNPDNLHAALFKLKEMGYNQLGAVQVVRHVGIITTDLREALDIVVNSGIWKK